VRLAILTAALSLIGCDMGVAAGAKAKPKTHTVTIEAMRFQPETLTVVAGDTIVWVNKDLVPHTATSRAASFDSKTIQADQSWRVTLRTKGDFAYICTLHPTMKAMLRVE
jgi:plastocyanin